MPHAKFLRMLSNVKNLDLKWDYKGRRSSYKVLVMWDIGLLSFSYSQEQM